MGRIDVVACVGLVVLDVEAAGAEDLVRLASEADVHHRVVTAVGREHAGLGAAGQVRRPAIHRRDEPGEGEDAGDRWPVCAEAHRVAHHRAHREAAKHGVLR